MTPSARQTLKSRLWRYCSVLAYHTGLLRLLRRWTNRFELRQDAAASRAPQVKRHRTGKLQILSFHRVAPEEDEFISPMPLEIFERQMQFLAKNCNVIELEQAAEGFEYGDLPDNAVVITFDDGYRDNYLHALPVLSSLSLPATVFLVTGVIGTGKLIWHDRVFRAFNLTGCVSLREFGAGNANLTLNGKSQRDEAQESTLRYLKSLDVDRRNAEIEVLLGRLEVDDTDDTAGLMLNWNEVREMHRAGISFGAHTVSHPVLSRIADEFARSEIRDSKQAIERELQCTVRAFAYPNGSRMDFTAATKRILRESGFRCALTTIFGTNAREPGCDPGLLELKRISIPEAHVAVFAAKLDMYRFVRVRAN